MSWWDVPGEEGHPTSWDAPEEVGKLRLQKEPTRCAGRSYSIHWITLCSHPKNRQRLKKKTFYSGKLFAEVLTVSPVRKMFSIILVLYKDCATTQDRKLTRVTFQLVVK